MSQGFILKRLEHSLSHKSHLRLTTTTNSSSLPSSSTSNDYHLHSHLIAGDCRSPKSSCCCVFPPLAVVARDGNGYWTRPGSVSVFTDLGPKKLDPLDPGRIRIRLNFTGPDPDLRKIPRSGPTDLEDPFFLY